MYYIAEAIHTVPCPVSPEEFKTAHNGHIALVNAAIDGGLILLAGPKPTEDGGFLLFRSDDESVINDFLASDPMVTCGAQRYVLTPWLIFDKAPNLKDLF